MAQLLNGSMAQCVSARLTITVRAVACFCVAVLLFVFPFTGRGQSYTEQFGQNRVQLRKFAWKFFDTRHFRVYHYDNAGRQLGRYVAEEAENDISVIEKKLGGQFPKRFNIILYNSYDEYRQSNVGLKDEAQEIGNAKGGTVNLVGDKLVVYFTGEHNDLQHQIRSGMARVVMERMMFGENFKKMVKNALLLNMPAWVTEGYIAYLVDGWDAKSNSEWKSLLEARPNSGFHELSNEYPELAGKAFWKFVSEQYSANTVKGLLYTMQQKTSMNKAMKQKENLGLKVTKAYDSCISFYKAVYEKDALTQDSPDSTKGVTQLKVPKDNSIVRNIRVSPRGTDVCYVVWKNGQYKVYSQKINDTKDVITLLEGGRRDLTEQTDPTYPMISWANTGNKMALLYKKGKDTRLRIYNSLNGRTTDNIIPKNRFDRVLSMTFIQIGDEDKLIFSAIKKSQTDLYLFTFKGSKMTNITNDVWDDVSPEFVSGGSRMGVLFLSNRPKPSLDVPLGVNELPTGPMNVFYYDLRTNQTKLLQCSNVKNATIKQPIQYGPDNFAYLCDSNGIDNKYVVLFAHDSHNNDSAYAVPVTNYTTSILCHQYNSATGNVADVVQDEDKYEVYFHKLDIPASDSDVKQLAPTTLSKDKAEAKTSGHVSQATPEAMFSKVNEEPMREEPAAPEIKGGNAFQSEFTDTTTQQPRKSPKPKKNNIFNVNAPAPDSSVLTVITDSAYLNMKPSPYKLSFRPDFFSVKLDNSILFTQYQSIASNGGYYKNPDLGGLMTLALNEPMEDFKIIAGLRLPINMSSSAYFLQYQNLRKRLDWGVFFLRTTDKQYYTVPYYNSNGRLVLTRTQLFKSISNSVQGDFSYPLDRVRSVRFHSALRQDKFVQKITDTFSLAFDVSYPVAYTSINRLEYVFDNTITPLLNISNGLKYKVYAEEIYGLNNGNRSCYNLGLDIRNYQRLYKQFILANRVAYAHSDGNSEVEYIAGGVDNWISPKQAAGGGEPPADNFGYQTLGTSLRGYNQYARTGNNFFVFTSELRLPIVATFVKRPVKSMILKNLQVVAFADIGDAWNGFMPTGDNLSAKHSYSNISQGGYTNLTLMVPGENSLAVGYGGGIRTTLLGYFLRMDAAWNIEGAKKPIIYFALGTDF